MSPCGEIDNAEACEKAVGEQVAALESDDCHVVCSLPLACAAVALIPSSEALANTEAENFVAIIKEVPVPVIEAVAKRLDGIAEGVDEYLVKHFADVCPDQLPESECKEAIALQKMVPYLARLAKADLGGVIAAIKGASWETLRAHEGQAFKFIEAFLDGTLTDADLDALQLLLASVA